MRKIKTEPALIFYLYLGQLNRAIRKKLNTEGGIRNEFEDAPIMIQESENNYIAAHLVRCNFHLNITDKMKESCSRIKRIIVISGDEMTDAVFFRTLYHIVDTFVAHEIEVWPDPESAKEKLKIFGELDELGPKDEGPF